MIEGEPDDLSIGNKSWDKMASTIHKEGYREGSAAGRDGSFQNGFDIGYKAGFFVGHEMGYFNGLLRAIQEHSDFKSRLRDQGIPNVTPFFMASKGKCIVCPDGSNPTKEDMAYSIIDTNRSIDSIIDEQNMIVQNEKVEKDIALTEMLNKLNVTEDMYK